MDIKEIRCKVRTGFRWLRLGVMAGCYEHGNELSSSIKDGIFFDKLNDCQLLKKDSASWS
jgi:hypothetical protein